MKKMILNIIASKIWNSKKFWISVSGIVIPLIMKAFDLPEELATQVWQSCLVLVVGQGIADSSKK